MSLLVSPDCMSICLQLLILSLVVKEDKNSVNVESRFPNPDASDWIDPPTQRRMLVCTTVLALLDGLTDQAKLRDTFLSADSVRL